MLKPLLSALLLLSSFGATAAKVQHAHLHNKVGARDLELRRQASSQVTPGFKTVGYYASWAIYARNWPITNLQVSELTHVFYAFGSIDNKTGEAGLGDPFADVQKLYPGDDNSTDAKTTLNGNLKQLYLLKKQNRNMKTSLSIGGWNLRTYFAPALASAEGRAMFAKTGVELMKDLGFDGVDIDWEYPDNEEEAANLVDTCRRFREELDAYSQKTTGGAYRFLLTLAVPAGPEHFKWFDVPGLRPYVDFLNLMAYDYQGSFSNYSGHSANLYKSETNPLSTDFDTQDPVDYFIGSGWDAKDLILGMPLYGRSFAETDGPGTKFTKATDGSWEAGVWDYKVLPLNGSDVSPVYFDEQVVGSWCYANETRYMVSYDEPKIAEKKAEYVNENGLGGAMWWETSGDLPLNDERSLIRTVMETFRQCGQIEQCQNWLDYETSKYTNLANGME